MSFLIYFSRRMSFVGVLLILFYDSAQAQQGAYTLKPSDLTVVNGVITACSYNYSSKDIIIPEKVNGVDITEIGKDVFRDILLTNVTLPPKLTKIGPSAFYHNRITSIVFPNGLTSIDSAAFYGNLLTNVSFPPSMTHLGKFALGDNLIKEITSFGGLKIISNWAFWRNKFTKIVIPPQIEHIGIGAFQANDGLQEIQFTAPSSIAFIGEDAFVSTSPSGNPTFILPINQNPKSAGYSDSAGKTYNPNNPSNNVASNLSLAYFLRIKYTLTDNDLIVDNMGVITSCKYDFSTDLSSKDIIIPETAHGMDILGIGKEVFKGKQLLTVDFPTKLKSVGEAAFQNNFLASLVFPDALATIETFAFYNNSKLETLNLGKVSYIGSYAFGQNNLKNVVFPAEIKSIGEYSFFSNLDLNVVTFSQPSSLLFIGANAFNLSAVSEITLPEHSDSRFLKYLGSNGTWYDPKNPANNKITNFTIFYRANLTYTLTDAELTVDGLGVITNCTYDFNAPTSSVNIIIPDKVGDKFITGIGNGVFLNKGLLSIQFPPNLTSIGQSAFKGNKLHEITIPKSIKFVESNAFTNNPDLDKVIFQSPSNIIRIYANSFSAGKPNSITLPFHTNTGFLKYQDSNGTAYDILDPSRNTISDFSRSYFSRSQYTLTGADLIFFNGIIIGCNNGLVGLTDITIPQMVGNQQVLVIGDNVFSSKGLFAVDFPPTLKSVGAAAFQNNLLASLKLPDGLTTIENDAFQNNRLATLALGKVSYIGVRAFKGNNLNNVVFPAEIKSIGDNSFSDNPNLKVVTFSQPSSLLLIGANAFNLSGVIEITLPEHSDSRFSKYLGSNGTLYDPKNPASNKITNFTIFYRANLPFTLTDAELTVDELGVITNCTYDFNAPTSSVNIIIPDKVGGKFITGIGNNVFLNKGLMSVQLPPNLASIGQSAFKGNKLHEITIPKSIKFVESNAFTNNPDLDKVVFQSPSNIIRIYANSFSAGKPNSITLPFHTSTGFLKYQDSNGTAYDILDPSRNTISDFSRSYFSRLQYTLTGADLTFTNGIITACNIDFFGLTDIIIPQRVGNEQVVGIGDNVFSNKGLFAVVFPSSFSSIGTGAFSNNQIREITFLGSVTQIGNGAFRNNKLTTFNFPKEITYISTNSFADNPLTTVTFSSPSKLLTIESNSFNSPSLPSIILPTNSTEQFISYVDSNGNFYDPGESTSGYIRDYTLSYHVRRRYTLTRDDVRIVNNVIVECTYNFDEPFSSKDITILDVIDGQNIYGIGENVFYNKGLISVVLPGLLRSIGKGAFRSNKISSLILKNGLTSIEQDAFKGNLLKEISLPTSLTSLGSGVFTQNQISQITSFGGVTNISPWAFESNNLTKIEIPKQIVSIGLSAFTLNPLTEVKFSEPSSILKITAQSFTQGKPTSITLPTNSYNGFKEYQNSLGVVFNPHDIITDFNFTYFAKVIYTLTDDDLIIDENGIITACTYNFSNLESSHKIIIPSTVRGVTVLGIGESVFSNKNLTSVALPSTLKSIGKSAFQNNNITTMSFTEGLISIGQDAFKGNLLEEISFPNSLTSLGSGGFTHNHISKITSFGGVTNISPWAFESNNLTKVEIPKEVVSIGTFAFNQNPLNEVKFSVPSGIIFIGFSSFSNGKPSSITLPIHKDAGFLRYRDDSGNTFNPQDGNNNKITDFNTNYYAEITYTLKEEDLEVDENGVITACNYDFSILSSSKNIIIPNRAHGKDIVGIGDNVFFAKFLFSVVLPTKLTSIGNYAFQNNYFASISFPNGLTTIGADAFKSNKLTKVSFPNSLVTIGEGAFYLNSISEIVSFGGLTNISAYSFSDNSLTSINIPKEIVFIGTHAFTNNPNLNMVTFLEPSRISIIDHVAFDQLHPASITLPTQEANSGFLNYKDSEGNTYNPTRPDNNKITDFSLSYFVVRSVNSGYVLTDDDFTVDEKGVIVGCKKETLLKHPFIVIPSTWKGQTIIGIGQEVFARKNLISVILPSNIVNIGKMAFTNNYLNSVTFPEGLISIEQDAFKQNFLEIITLPASLVSLGTGAFTKNLITEIASFGGLTTINSWTFEDNKLATITIPKDILIINRYSFTINPLTTVTFATQSNISRINANAFSSGNLNYIKLPLHAGNDFLYYEDSNGNTYRPEDDNNSRITDFGISYFPRFRGYTLADDDITVDKNGVIIACKAESILKHPDIIIPLLWKGQPITGIGKAVFSKSPIQSVVFNDQITHIDSAAFSETPYLTDLVLPPFITSIGANAFIYNNFKGELKIPASLTTIGSRAFYKFVDQTNKFSRVYFEEKSQIIKIGLGAFSNCYRPSSSQKTILLPNRATPNRRFYWKDGFGNELVSNFEISDFETSYEAFLTELVTLTLNAENGKIMQDLKPTVESNFYDKDSQITLTPVPNAGFGFEKWTISKLSPQSEEESISNPLVIKLITSINLTAHFVEQVELTTTAEHGTITMMPARPTGTTTVNLNSNISFSATPEEGYRLTKWVVISGATSTNFSDKTLKIKISGPTHVTAYFVKQVKLTLLSEVGMIEVSPKPNPDINTFDIDTEVTLRIGSVPDGSTFAKWVLFQNSSFTESFDWPLVFTLKKDVTVRAILKQNATLAVISDHGSVAVSPKANDNIYTPGTKITLRPTADAGYNFDRWILTDEDATNESREPNITFVLNKNTTATAVFIPPQVTLSLVHPNGEIVVEPGLRSGLKTYDVNSFVAISFTPQPGYEFVKWILSGRSGSSIENSDRFLRLTLLKDTTVTAVTSRQKVTLEVDHTGNGNIDMYPQVANNLYSYNTVVTLIPMAEEKYVFDKWVLSGPSGTSMERTVTELNLILTSDTLVKAHFIIPQVRLNVVADHGTFSVMPEPTSKQGGTYDINTEVTVKVTPNPGFRFEKWTLSNGIVVTKVFSTPQITITLPFNTTLQAYFSPKPKNKVRLGLSVEHDLGIITGGQNGVEYDIGTELELNVKPLKGYRFEKWTLSGSGNPIELSDLPLRLVMTKDTVVYAYFVPLEHEKITLTLLTSGSGNISGSNNQVVYDIGANVVLDAIPLKGYVFQKWLVTTEVNISEYTATPLDIILNSNTNVEAFFVKASEKVTLTLYKVGLGIVSGADNGEEYPKDTQIVLTAAPYLGYEFELWEINNSEGSFTQTSPTFELNLSFSTTVIARFVGKAKVQLVLKVIGPGSISGAADGDELYMDTELTLTAVPDQNYELEKWVVTGLVEQPKDMELKLKLTANTEVVAHFKLLDAILGIDDFAETNISYFPNPVSRLLMVNSKGLRSVRLLNMVGAVIFNSIPAGLTQIEFDVSNIPSSTYFLELTQNDGKVIVKKIMKN